MKKLLVLFCFSILFLNTKAQTSVYHPFPDSNAVWNIRYQTAPCQANPPWYEEDYSIVFSGDTIIKGVSYHKLYRPFIYQSNPSCMPNNFKGLEGVIRQDIPNRMVYIIGQNNLEELLYDFNLNVGDTVKGFLTELCPDSVVVVDQKDSVMIDSYYRTIWKLSHSLTQSLYVIEGIGFLSEPIYIYCPYAIEKPLITLVCFKQNGKTLYPDTTASCDIIDRVNDLSEENISISAYPNPTSDKITISGYSLSGKARIEIYNMMGDQVFVQSEIINHKSEIDISSLPSGVYIVQIMDGEKIFRGKIIKE